MLENCKTAQERWGGTHQIIDRWLANRQTLLVAYFKLSTEEPAAHQVERLQRFCQLLVDYVSAGHFEVFEQLIREAKEFDDGEGLKLANNLYPKLELNTQQLIEFNDKYDGYSSSDTDELLVDLSPLGEQMSERFEMEDRLIERLHIIHAEQLS